MKLIVKTPKPRNPLVPAAHKRLAGMHRRSGGGARQQHKSALRRELTQQARPGP